MDARIIHSGGRSRQRSLPVPPLPVAYGPLARPRPPGGSLTKRSLAAQWQEVGLVALISAMAYAARLLLVVVVVVYGG